MHHAHCFVGKREDAWERIPADERKSDTDVTILQYTQFTIDDARSLKVASSQRPFSRTERIFIVIFQSATLEAQNALLKLLEEPAPTTRFYFIIPFEDVFIPTVRSRLHIERVNKGAPEGSGVLAEFLGHSYGDRLALIAKRTKEKDDVWCEALLREAEAYAAAHPKESGSEILFVTSLIRGSGASKKMLLEHLALSL